MTLPAREQQLRTKVKKAKMLKALHKTKGIVTHAAAIAGFAARDHYLWLKKDSKYKKAVEEILDDQFDFVESKLFENIDANKTAEILFYLKCKGGKRRYQEKQESNVEVTVFSDKTPTLKNIEDIEIPE